MGTRVRLRAIRRALSCLAVIGVFCGQIMHAPHRAQTLRQARRDLPEDHIVATASAGAAPRIAFRLHAPDVVPRPDRFLSVPRYVCGDGRGGDDGARGALPPAPARASVLNFTATVSTDLRVLFLGDSLTQQLAQAFDAAALPPGDAGTASRRVLGECRSPRRETRRPRRRDFVLSTTCQAHVPCSGPRPLRQRDS